MRLRLAVFVSLGVLISAGSASAAFSPTFSVTSDADENLTVNYAQGATDDPANLLEVFVPNSVLANLGLIQGQQIGTVSGHAAVADQGGSSQAVTGTITFQLPTDLVGGVAISTAAANCRTPTASVAGAGQGTANFVLNMTVAGQQWQVLLVIDTAITGRVLSDVVGQIFNICLPPPDVPAGTAGRAPLGAKLTDLKLSLPGGIFASQPGFWTWHLRATPYTPATGKPNAAGIVEAEGLDRTPQELTLAARVDAKTHKVVATGQVKAGGKGVSGVAVQISAGKKVVGKVTSGAGGKFKVSLTTSASKLTATATAAARNLPACVAPLFAPAPCRSAIAGAFTATSDPVSVKKK